MSVHVQNSRMTTSKLRQMKASGEKIAMLTSYDFTLASLVDEAGIDMLLVGDSASNIVCGNLYTLPITVDEMIFLTKGVVRAAQHALVVCDMPFGSYQISEEEAVRNAIKIMKESGCDAVKLEGGEEILPAIRHMIQAGVPVMGHLGLTPQSVNQFGGYGLRRNSLTGWARAWRRCTLLDALRSCSLLRPNRSDIFFSARKAFKPLSPPRNIGICSTMPNTFSAVAGVGCFSSTTTSPVFRTCSV